MRTGFTKPNSLQSYMTNTKCFPDQFIKPDTLRHNISAKFTGQYVQPLAGIELVDLLYFNKSDLLVW